MGTEVMRRKFLGRSSIDARAGLYSRGMPVLPFKGNVYHVDSGHANASDSNEGTDPNRPLATLDAAVGKCTANNGDVILVSEGHAENLAADSAVDIDVAGVTVIGLGSGAARPTFTCTAVAGDFKLAAASVVIQNLLFLNDVDQSTGLLEVSAADCQILDCEIREKDSSAKQANVYLITTAAADRLLLDGLKVNQAGADAGPVSAIDLVGADDCEIRNSRFYGNFSTSIIDCKTTASLRLWIHDCEFWQENAADVCIKDTVTGSSGQIGPELRMMLQDNAANITEAITGATFHVFDPVYVCNLVNEKGMLINWTASTDA